MIDIFVNEAKIEDALYVKEKVKLEELHEAIAYYNHQNDEEINKAIHIFEKEVESQSIRYG